MRAIALALSLGWALTMSLAPAEADSIFDHLAGAEREEGDGVDASGTTTQVEDVAMDSNPFDNGAPSFPVPPAGTIYYPGPPAYTPPPPDETDARNVCLNDAQEVVGVACAEPIATPEPDEPAAPEPQGPPAIVTISDIASFFPAPASVVTEPAGIGAKNMPLNTVATAGVQTLAGELFGFPVSVTFTPAGFRHSWGDGTTTESPNGGATWASLDQAEFTPTATSHAYSAKGTYDLAVSALYTAVVDFGEWGTRSVDGVIEVPGAAQSVRIVEVHTALVAHDCVEDPAGVGCPAG